MRQQRLPLWPRRGGATGSYDSEGKPEHTQTVSDHEITVVPPGPDRKATNFPLHAPISPARRLSQLRSCCWEASGQILSTGWLSMPKTRRGSSPRCCSRSKLATPPGTQDCRATPARHRCRRGAPVPLLMVRRWVERSQQLRHVFLLQDGHQLLQLGVTFTPRRRSQPPGSRPRPTWKPPCRETRPDTRRESGSLCSQHRWRGR